ncbi:hypothetical protein GIB67_035309, partial [Kingdonia uniflora]
RVGSQWWGTWWTLLCFYQADSLPISGMFKFDDERVTKEDMKRALEEQYSGEEEQLPQTKPGFNNTLFKLTKYSNAYMFVYIRDSDKDKIICNVDEKDIAAHLRERLMKELEEKEHKIKEKAEAHLYTIMKVMEQQTVSIAKAGIIASLNAKISVFDLIYLLLDKADKVTDSHLAKHIVAMHFENPEVLLACQSCQSISDETSEELIQRYIELRRGGNFPGSNTKVITATPRQIERLIRVSEALARIHFSKQVSAVLFINKKVNLLS